MVEYRTKKHNCPASRSPQGFRLGLRLVLALLLLLSGLPAHAQGCAQCLDSTRATPPQVQAAYRHAIYLLAGAGTSLFLAGTLLLRKRL